MIPPHALSQLQVLPYRRAETTTAGAYSPSSCPSSAPRRLLARAALHRDDIRRHRARGEIGPRIDIVLNRTKPATIRRIFSPITSPSFMRTTAHQRQSLVQRSEEVRTADHLRYTVPVHISAQKGRDAREDQPNPASFQIV